MHFCLVKLLVKINMKHLFLSLMIALCSFNMLNSQELVPVLDRGINKYGYKEKDKNDWSLQPIYEKANAFKDKVAAVHNGEYSYFIDLHGKKVSPYFKEVTRDTHNAYMPIIGQGTDGKFNLYDYQFHPVLPDFYEYMGLEFVCFNYVIKFKQNGLYGIMDLSGNVLIPAVYKNLQKLDDLYYCVGYKRCDKDKITKSVLDGIFYEAINTSEKYGIVSVKNEVIVPFKYNGSYNLKYKGAKACYNKVIKPFVLSSKKKAIEEQLDEVYSNVRKKNEELSKAYPTTLPQVTKTIIKKTKQGYVFMKGKSQVGKTYQMVDEYSNFCIVKRNKKLGVSDMLGSEVVECKYDDINLWNEKEGILMAESKGKYSLFTADGSELSKQAWDLLFFPSNDVAVGLRNGQYWLLNAKGNVISSCGYDNIDNYSNDKKVIAYRMGYSTELGTDGKEISPIARQIFDEAYKMSTEEQAQEKFDKYMLCIAVDSDNKQGLKSTSLNNIGALFEDLGDVDKALDYYGQAKILGSETARKNIKRIKFDRTMNVLQQVGETLTQVAQTIDTSGTFSSTLPTSGSYDTSGMGSSSLSTSGSGGKHSYEYWKQMYDRWERNAKSCYESLTLNGYKTKTNGKDSGGSAAGTWNSASYTGMKQNLRKAQKEMRETRALARKEGHNIPQSNYETINVSY